MMMMNTDTLTSMSARKMINKQIGVSLIALTLVAMSGLSEGRGSVKGVSSFSLLLVVVDIVSSSSDAEVGCCCCCCCCCCSC
jgi:hypothetical protein